MSHRGCWGWWGNEAEANVTNEADEPTNERGRWADQAYDGEVSEADEAYLVGKATDATEVAEADEVDMVAWRG